MHINIIKENVDIFSDFLLSGFNHSIKTSTLPWKLKQANKTPAFKKGDKNLKEKDRPFSVCQICRRYLSRSYSKKFLTLRNLSSLNSSEFLKRLQHTILSFIHD